MKEALIEIEAIYRRHRNLGPEFQAEAAAVLAALTEAQRDTVQMVFLARVSFLK